MNEEYYEEYYEEWLIMQQEEQEKREAREKYALVNENGIVLARRSEDEFYSNVDSTSCEKLYLYEKKYYIGGSYDYADFENAQYSDGLCTKFYMDECTQQEAKKFMAQEEYLVEDFHGEKGKSSNFYITAEGRRIMETLI